VDDGRGVVVGWKSGGATIKLTGSGQDGLLAERELGNTLIPALDDLADTDGALEGRAAVARRVELGAVGEGTNVLPLARFNPGSLQWMVTLSPFLGKVLPSPGLIT
jgi:hypothetical protein